MVYVFLMSSLLSAAVYLIHRPLDAAAELRTMLSERSPHFPNLSMNLTDEQTAWYAASGSYIIEQVEGYPVVYNDGHTFVKVPPYRFAHQSRMIPDLDHICVCTNAAQQQFAIAVPAEPRLAFLNEFERPVPIQYLRMTEEHGQKTAYYLEANDDRFMASMALAAVYRHPRFRQYLDAAIEDQAALTRLHDLLHSWLGVSVALVLLAFLMFPAFDRRLASAIRRAAIDSGLDPELVAPRLMTAVHAEWLAGKPLIAIEKRLARECRQLYREQARELARTQREKLREALGEQRTSALLAETERRAKEAATRIVRGTSTLTKELQSRKQEQRPSESTRLAQVSETLETAFIAHVEAELEEESKQPPPDQKRDKLLHAVHACTRELVALSAMPDKDLEMLAGVIRSMKRTLNREAFKRFIEEFDGSRPATYRRMLELALAGKFNDLQTALTAPPAHMTSSDDCIILPTPILSGKRVLIVGGIPSLSEFYTQHAMEFGAASVVHVTDENPARVRGSNPDLVVVCTSRISHKQEAQAAKLCPLRVRVDRATRSGFPRSFAEALTTQL